MKPIAPKTRDEWMAVWSALTQFVDNNDPDDCAMLSADERAQHAAAKMILDRYDAEMARLAQ